MSSANTSSTRLATLKEAITSRYGNADQFLEMFNPDRQLLVASDIHYVYRGESPRLINVAAAYGMHIAEAWLEIQLQNLSEFAGCKEKLSTYQSEELSRTIIAEYGYFKVSEFMYFFHRFKAGHYGKFYGTVDSLTVTTALQSFRKERNDILEQMEREEERQRRQNLRAESERESKAFWNALKVCNMSILEWHTIHVEHHLTADELEALGWLFKLTPTKAERI